MRRRSPTLEEMFESIQMPIMRKGLVAEKIIGEKENRANIDNGLIEAKLLASSIKVP